MLKTTPIPEKLVPSAKIVDGFLILTLPDALRPVIWQMELGQTKSSAVEVREGSDGTYTLMLKTGRQDVQEIAPYASRELAVRALLTLSRTMEAAQGRLRGANNNLGLNPNQLPVVIPQTAAGRSKAVRMLIGIGLLLVLLYAVTLISSPEPSSPGTSSQTAAPAKVGQPQSAEDYLNSQ